MAETFIGPNIYYILLLYWEKPLRFTWFELNEIKTMYVYTHLLTHMYILTYICPKNIYLKKYIYLAVLVAVCDWLHKWRLTECEHKGFVSCIKEESLQGSCLCILFLSFVFNGSCWCLLSPIMMWKPCIEVDGNKAEKPGSLVIIDP